MGEEVLKYLCNYLRSSLSFIDVWVYLFLFSIRGVSNKVIIGAGLCNFVSAHVVYNVLTLVDLFNICGVSNSR